METKIIANYLPQFHRIPENDKWWGEGYTDWEAVKKSKSLFKGHNQPRVPLDGYYDLSRTDTIKWQASIAKKYGIYGFGIYHYWFSSSLHLLDKPADNLLNDKTIDIHFMFIWDNGSWKRTWSNVTPFTNDWAPLYENSSTKTGKDGILARLEYGGKNDWKKHFEYLLPFFKDSRYIKLNDKPLFAFFNQDNEADKITQMCDYWNELALESGLSGITFLGKKKRGKPRLLEYEFTYEPEWSGWTFEKGLKKLFDKTKYIFEDRICKVHKYSYKTVWKRIIKYAKNNADPYTLPGAFVRYDDSPRRGKKGRIIVGDSPETFKEYLRELIKICDDSGKEFIFLTAWNEWGEGAYLEPDTMEMESYLYSLSCGLRGF